MGDKTLVIPRDTRDGRARKNQSIDRLGGQAETSSLLAVLLFLLRVGFLSTPAADTQ